MNDKMCPGSTPEDPGFDDLPSALPSLRDVLRRVAKLDNKRYLHEASGAASEGRALYGAVVWYDKHGAKLYTGLSDGPVVFSVGSDGTLDWMPQPITNYEINQIILRANNKADTFKLMLHGGSF